jgi:ribosomal protein L16/L10AE
MIKFVQQFVTTYTTKQKFKKFFLPPNLFKTCKFLRLSSINFKKFLPETKRITDPSTAKSSFSFFSRKLLIKNRRKIFRISIKSTSSFFVKLATINSIKRLTAPFFRGKQNKKISVLKINTFPTFNFTKKPLAVRIGGGVGKKIRFSGFFVRPGFEIFVVYTLKPSAIYKRFFKLRKKFSRNVKIVVN